MAKTQISTERFYKGTPCWEFTASKSVGGYGYFFYITRQKYVHRIAYEWLIGELPPFRSGVEVDHLCKNRPCWNPCHLEAVTRLENIHRSDWPAGVNARKTHCNNGHEYTEATLMTDKYGSRRCRICFNAYRTTPERLEKRREWRERNAEKVRAQNLATYHRNAEKNKQRMREAYHRKRGNQTT